MDRSRKGSGATKAVRDRSPIALQKGRSSILWPTVLAVLTIIPALMFHADRKIALVFGEYLMLCAVVYWCVGWFLWLSQDGLSFLSAKHGSRARTKAEIWREEVRLPGMEDHPGQDTAVDGDPPAQPDHGISPTRSENTTSSLAQESGSGYRFPQRMPSVANSGNALRKAEGGGSDGKARGRTANRALAKRLALSGSLVFAVGALFQYVLAMLPWMP